MLSNRQAFLNYLAPTSDSPLSLEIESDEEMESDGDIEMAID